MIRHAPGAMGIVTFGAITGILWSRATEPDLLPFWIGVTILCVVATLVLLLIIPGSSDE